VAARRGAGIATRLRGESGSAPAEFVMVSALLSVLTLAVLQLGLALHVRNTVQDAAAEGARYGSLADSSLAAGVDRTRDLISTALGPGFATDVTATTGTHLGYPAAEITVRTPLPLLGLVGIDDGLEVRGHAAIETLD
jgi:Flp pilus assembly protein TadG